MLIFFNTFFLKLWTQSWITMKRPYSADTVVRVFATVRDRSFENTINNNNYSDINDNNNNK